MSALTFLSLSFLICKRELAEVTWQDCWGGLNGVRTWWVLVAFLMVWEVFFHCILTVTPAERQARRGQP